MFSFCFIARMGYLENIQLRDLEAGTKFECQCPSCNRIWLEKVETIKRFAEHRDVYLDELARTVSCGGHMCPQLGVKLTIIDAHDTSPFVGGMP